MNKKLMLLLSLLPLIVSCGSVTYADGCEKGKVESTFYEYKSQYVYGNAKAMKATGEGKVLIIPIWFSDSIDCISEGEKEGIRDNIRKAYIGTNEETGWRSVKTFYEEESWGALKLDAVVTDWYECGKSSATMGSSNGRTNLCLKDAVAWYKETYNDDCKQFDADGDGFIDAVIMIYGYKNYANLKDTSKDNLWAYCYHTNNVANVDSPTPSSYFWASYDFMYDSDNGGYGWVRNCKIDTHTYIHEMGHILGAEDYYDYANIAVPAGGFSMQDYNVGGHDPFSRLGYGWVKPYVPTESCQVTIKPFEENGDLILLSPNYEDSIFDEYLLLELYTPTGVNEFDSVNRYENRYPKGPENPGFRIWHVDARLAWSDGGSLGAANITNKIELGKTYMIAPTNTSYTTDEKYMGHMSIIPSLQHYYHLQLLRKDNEGMLFEENDLWKTGDKFSIGSVKGQFYNGTKMNNGKKLGWEVEFVEVTAEGATLKIAKK